MTRNPTNEELANWDESSRLVALVDRIRHRFDRGGRDSLNEAEQTILTLYELYNEVCNGGFGQWLFHTGLDLIEITPACLDRIGDVRVRNQVQCILEELGRDALHLEGDAFDDYLHCAPDAFWDLISKNDLAYAEFEPEMSEKLVAYASKMMTEIRMP